MQAAIDAAAAETNWLQIDGPYIETKEQLAGFFIDVKDIDAAIGIASSVPGARIGTVEIHPVRDVPRLPTAKLMINWCS